MPRSASYLKVVSNRHIRPEHPKGYRLTIGQILLSRKWVNEIDLLKAWSLQRYENAPIGEILIGLGKITADQLYRALSVQYSLNLIDLNTHPPSVDWVKFSDPQHALKEGYIVWRQTEGTLTIAVTDPTQIAPIRQTFQQTDKWIDFVLIKPNCLQNYIARTCDTELARRALSTCPTNMSCRSWSKWTYIKTLIFACLISLSFLFLLIPAVMLKGLLILTFIALISLIIFRISCYLILHKHLFNQHADAKPSRIIKQPKVSILVPLYKESSILNRLVDRLSVLSYPKELLEICLIYEENDLETKTALMHQSLPAYMKRIEVPYGHPQTKPRAMNYALDFCSGYIVGIYDAEDAPEVNQIERVVQKFATCGSDIACVQCVLDFYNAKTNWISRCFTLEYSILFRLILPALDRMCLPIPLGGTSVFFRRDILEKLGRWDAHNVTEDADLGYRLYRLGYRCAWIDAVTYEEANYRLVAWIKQRSRWLKGLFITALVHFKTPLKLHAQIGSLATFTMVSMLIVPWILCPLVPLILPLWLLTFGVDLPFYTSLPTWGISILTAAFITNEILMIFLAYSVTHTKQHKHLRPWVITMIAYWPIAFLASYKALYEIFTNATYWDKSEHGLNDQDFTETIKSLTKEAGSKQERDTFKLFRQ